MGLGAFVFVACVGVAALKLLGLETRVSRAETALLDRVGTASKRLDPAALARVLLDSTLPEQVTSRALGRVREWDGWPLLVSAWARVDAVRERFLGPDRLTDAAFLKALLSSADAPLERAKSVLESLPREAWTVPLGDAAHTSEALNREYFARLRGAGYLRVADLLGPTIQSLRCTCGTRLSDAEEKGFGLDCAKCGSRAAVRLDSGARSRLRLGEPQAYWEWELYRWLPATANERRVAVPETARALGTDPLLNVPPWEWSMGEGDLSDRETFHSYWSAWRQMAGGSRGIAHLVSWVVMVGDRPRHYIDKYSIETRRLEHLGPIQASDRSYVFDLVWTERDGAVSLANGNIERLYGSFFGWRASITCLAPAGIGPVPSGHLARKCSACKRRVDVPKEYSTVRALCPHCGGVLG